MSLVTVSHPNRPLQLLGEFARPVILGLPALFLGIASVRAAGPTHAVLAVGAGVLALGAFICLLPQTIRAGATRSGGMALYFMGLSWLWMATRRNPDWFTNLAQALLLLGPLLAFGLLSLRESGAAALRRAHTLTNHLIARKDLPSNLTACRALAPVRALREAIRADGAPALMLLGHPRMEVRIAGLCALEGRRKWRHGQVELVLHLAQGAKEPLIRAAAVGALGAVEDRLVVEALAPLLWDASWEVRRAAVTGLLSNNGKRWPWIRHAVRRALAEPALHNDGPLQPTTPLEPEAVADLTAWSAEKGLLSVRAALTLGAHYARALRDRPEEGLIQTLRAQVDNPHTPPTLRVELARVLQTYRELDRPLLERLLMPGNAAPLRLLAVETLLAEGGHPDAVNALRDLARLPNREIALATADLLQKRLGVDLGMPLGAPMPPLHSRQAAEITRRVMQWANDHDRMDEDVEDSR